MKSQSVSCNEFLCRTHPCSHIQFSVARKLHACVNFSRNSSAHASSLMLHIDNDQHLREFVGNIAPINLKSVKKWHNFRPFLSQKMCKRFLKCNRSLHGGKSAAHRHIACTFQNGFGTHIAQVRVFAHVCEFNFATHSLWEPEKCYFWCFSSS